MPPPRTPKPWFAWYPVKAMIRLSERSHALPLDKTASGGARFTQADIGKQRWFWLSTVERVWRNGRWDYSLPTRRSDGLRDAGE